MGSSRSLPAAAGLPGERLAALRARAALSLGRHHAALAALRRLPRHGRRQAWTALAEADALLALQRGREAAAVATRALRRGAGDADLAARLELVRAQAYWACGRLGRARRALAALPGAELPERTLARRLELDGLVAWRERRTQAAERSLAEAQRVFLAHEDLVGLVRVMGAAAALARDAGRRREALARLSRRVELAQATTRLDLLALAQHDRALLLAALGRWHEARSDAEAARTLFQALGDPRELSLALLALARIDMASDRLDEARAALERARQASGAGASVELALAFSDLALAEGQAEPAAQEAERALHGFTALKDERGRARALVRLGHARSTAGRHVEAAAHARQALRLLGGGPARLRALAELTLGRALLRSDRRQAEAAFARAQSACGAHDAVAHLARLGLALAADPEGAEVRAAIDNLRGWGDARLVSMSQAECRRLLDPAPPPGDEPGLDVEPGSRERERSAAARPVTATVGPALACPDGEDEHAAPLPGLLGRCERLLALAAQVRRVAASDVAVFVLGETGTGKERVARALHDHSRRARGPFVALNVSSLSDELFEAELCGHARGAFTGAVAAREGLLAQAAGGTLFLDEVADLTPRAQAKLLRILQEGEYRRLGESELRRADVRVVSAANRDLERCVAAGSFREDLLYRLNTVVLPLPPLRERGDDLLLLARHFARLAAQRAGRATPVLGPELRAALGRYTWPGNVRQLENEMTRLVTLAGDGPLSVSQLSPRVLAALAEGEPAAAGLPEGVAAAAGSLRAAQLEFERGFITGALRRHAGRRAATASFLGITRQALFLKMQRLGLA